MGRTVSGRELRNGREEYDIEYNSVLLAKIAEGKRVPKSNDTLGVGESLISKTKSKARIVSHDKIFAPQFKKYAGRKAPTAKIFEDCITRTEKQENTISA